MAQLCIKVNRALSEIPRKGAKTTGTNHDSKIKMSSKLEGIAYTPSRVKSILGMDQNKARALNPTKYQNSQDGLLGANMYSRRMQKIITEKTPWAMGISCLPPFHGYSRTTTRQEAKEKYPVIGGIGKINRTGRRKNRRNKGNRYGVLFPAKRASVT
ncbi:hypothetical protein GF1_21160 [Desulfolithobacter dissulfuricans]|uniref:Uncharacterized protein n=1 Tax=Desulfolithobacter dissulfuricans TaxID=2795293 RepID=A0A915UAN0_9BACT|nr:hypothetical protein GF1_21160 [Desulfolithobacter dissulfuricans]